MLSQVHMFVLAAVIGEGVEKTLSQMTQMINDWIRDNPQAQNLKFFPPEITVLSRVQCLMTMMATYTVADEDIPLAERAEMTLRDRRAPAVVLRAVLLTFGDAGQAALQALERAQGRIHTILRLVMCFPEELREMGIQPSDQLTIGDALALHGLHLSMTTAELEKLGIPMAQQF